VHSREVKSEKGYFDHLEDLRFEIIYVLIFFLVSCIVSFLFSEKLVSLLTGPVTTAGAALNYFKPQEKFMSYLKVSFLAGVFLSVPFLLWRAASFISPGLDPSERPVFLGAVFVSPLLFYGGAAFAYFVIIPFALSFFNSFGGADIAPVWGIENYVNLAAAVMAACGTGFLLPALLFGLIKAGVIKTGHVNKFRPYFIIAIFIFAAVITPPDVITQIMTAVPIYLLFEISVLLANAGKKGYIK
jgi:sec-independent protein translocase protein TatC